MGATAVVAAALAAFFAIPQFRHQSTASVATLPTVRADQEKAGDLVEHYYRPQSLETAIPLLETLVRKDPAFAPAFADLGRANLLQFI